MVWYLYRGYGIYTYTGGTGGMVYIMVYIYYGIYIYKI